MNIQQLIEITRLFEENYGKVLRVLHHSLHCCKVAPYRGNYRFGPSSQRSTLQLKPPRAKSSPIVSISSAGVGDIQLFNSVLKPPPHFRL